MTASRDEPETLPSSPAPGWENAVVYTIGHSTRPQAELIDLLHRHGVVTLVDVRTMPRSRRNPQFNIETLAHDLPAAGIAYARLPKLGGLRRGLGEASPNGGWRNTSFRAYADHMLGDDFAEGLAELRGLTEAGPVALMCAEAVPWRCHRSLIADALLVRGVVPHDIQGPTRAPAHTLTPFAHVDGEHITYPPYEDPAASDTT
ncbi:MAG: DUF488 domain-containing protein [Thermomicrobiales bacterium]|nr:DUF488 domain-containing protein [Thermomicrobiales bacterium]